MAVVNVAALDVGGISVAVVNLAVLVEYQRPPVPDAGIDVAVLDGT